MFNKFWVKSLPILLLMVFWGVPAPGFADWGMGYGPYPRWGHHRMHAWHHGAEESCTVGYWGNLSEEDIQKLEKERTDFFEDTKNLRANIYQKRLELKSELAKENPDAQRAAELQTEISKMKAEFDQKRLSHFLNIRKINPDMRAGFGRGYGMMGPGKMHHSMMEPWEMGSGRYGSRYCPNYPSGGFRGDYGMGPGMMGPAWGMGMNPSRSDREKPQHMSRHMGSLEEKDAQKIVENYIQSTRNPNLKAGKIEDSGNAFKAQIVTRDNSLVEEVLIDKRSGYMRPAY
jgi:hypothetical protein